MKLTPLTDSTILLTLGSDIDLAVNRRIHALAATLARNLPEGVTETVPAYASLTVHYDPLKLTHIRVVDWLTSQLNLADDLLTRATRKVDVPVTYDGPDLEFVALHCCLSIPEVIRVHTGTEYTVFMMGFTPGFPYLGALPEVLRVPRLPAPRAHVPAGTVAIAGMQTGIYPLSSPGGWRLIGHTDLSLLNPQSSQPFMFAPGDTVSFYEADVRTS